MTVPSASHPPRCRIGTSGYAYEHWRGVLYPPDSTPRRWLPLYAARFDTVEINASFYRLPAAATFASWRHQVARDFCFAIKYSRYGSHLKHLRDPRTHLDLFLERIRPLGPQLGPILVQLPPRWRVDVARLDEFLAAAPRRQRWALEFRHPSWLCGEVYAVLRRHGAALCIHDMVPKHPREITTGWTYLRYHGRVANGNYTSTRLGREAARIRAYRAAGLDVYAYFNNDLHGHAVWNAAALRRRLADPRADVIQYARAFTAPT